MLASQRRKRLPPAPDDATLRAALRRTAEREQADDRGTAEDSRTGPACALMPGIPRGTLLCELPPRDVPVVLCWDDC
ncbi:hypothetical protein [Nitratidesulfovibrio liaohensis]|uniref:Uncharacterized protein n=1 Tax=Nitratidesulfovibrio liaohensis TaxID=2604158 RepID=A0ABY9R048_9BACT|nr:hypothetical protein [Nitratidesulfovibrio liaohensis]WMW64834.1 hypothetical protein KPS_002900 [Nitratidesulfovibrio liaohensis]